MPVMTKVRHAAIKKELGFRVATLLDAFDKRELKRPSEGARGSWVHPEDMCATLADNLHLRLAVDDFKAILSEIRKLK